VAPVVEPMLSATVNPVFLVHRTLTLVLPVRAPAPGV
jgi:hypothetical protein